MKRPFVLISCIPNSPQFLWETANNLMNQRKFGISNKAQVLIFLTHSALKNGFDSRWQFLEKKFPEVKFFYYKDTSNIERIIRAFDYIPLLRSYMLQKHWEKYPELQDSAIYYHDSDTVFTQFPTFLRDLKDDDVNYLSDTKSYLNYDYLISKEADVLREKKELFRVDTIIDKMAGFFEIPAEKFKENNNSTGGAQYFLKNIDRQFWVDVFNNCVDIRTYLSDINKRFFKDENSGYQSWCADMWAVLGNLWKRNMKVETPKVMDFCWATEYTDQWDKKIIYHDANASPDTVEKDGKKFRTFWKKGVSNSYIEDWESDKLKTPFQDDLSYVSPELCSFRYVEEILKTKKYILS